MRFAEALEAGDIVTVNPHEEFISFGLNLDEVDLLPHFYDFTTNLPNGDFTVDVTLTYTDEELAELGLFESELTIWHYNELTDEWELVDSIVDTDANTISFTTSHFSIYAIGTNPIEPEIVDLETKYRWGKYNSEEEIRTAAVSFANNSGEILTEPVTLFVSDINPTDATLSEYDERDSFGYYITIKPEEYGHCFFDVAKNQLPIGMRMSDRRRILEHRPYSCERMLEKYPALKIYEVYGLGLGKYSNPTPLIFGAPKESRRFRFEANLIQPEENFE
ncbi:MAG: hypothetical protein R3B69_02975 [Candidatus Paceibacterota bacterium]